MKVFVLIPIYNEELNIPELHRGLTNSFLKDFDVHYVFSDDGSKDKSVELLQKNFEGHSFKVLTVEQNMGPGHAFNAGFEYILSQGDLGPNDVVLTIESDNTSDLTDAQKMVAISQLGYDLVLASIYAQGGGYGKTSFLRKFLSSVANLMFRFLFDLKTLTLSSFFRVYKVSALQNAKQLNGTLINEHGFICMLEILLKFTKANHSVIEVPTTLRVDRRQGKSKMKIVKTTITYFTFLLNNKVKKAPAANG